MDYCTRQIRTIKIVFISTSSCISFSRFLVFLKVISEYLVTEVTSWIFEGKIKVKHADGLAYLCVYLFVFFLIYRVATRDDISVLDSIALIFLSIPAGRCFEAYTISAIVMDTVFHRHIAYIT